MPLEVIIHQPLHRTHETPLLFVHGAWHGAWCWEEHFLPYFTKLGYECHALSLRGHGHSPLTGWLPGASIKDYVADVTEVASRMQPAPALIAHAMGGFVVQKVLEDHAAPAGVLLASIPPGGAFTPTIRFLSHDLGAFLRGLGNLSTFHTIESREHAQWAFFSDDMPEDQVRQYFRKMSAEPDGSGLDMLLFTRVRPKRVKTPLLVLGASRDAIIPPHLVEQTARAYGVQPEYFDMAHDMMLEAGWEQVAGRLAAWLAERGV